MKYKAALIGLGNASVSFGEDKESSSSLSHHSAYVNNPFVEVIAGFSPYIDEVKAFEKQIGIQGVSSLSELLSCQPDVVSICSPTNKHAEQLEICIDAGIPMVWLEKPAAGLYSEILQLQKKTQEKQNKTLTLVNFNRRYQSSYNKLKSLIKNNKLGGIDSVNIVYSKGLDNNGIHMLDIIFYLFDNLDCEILWNDFSSDRKNPSFILGTKDKFKIYFIGTNTSYHNIDISVTFEMGRASIVHGGMTTRLELRCENEGFPGFYRLNDSEDDLLGPGGFARSFDYALDDLIKSYEHDLLPRSNLITSSLSQRLFEKVTTF